MNKRALGVVIFLVALLVLPSVSAVENSHIAVYPVSTSPSCYQFSGYQNLPNIYYFTNESNYTWPSTIPNNNGVYYQTRPSEESFYWNCPKPNVTFYVPFSGLFGLYVMRYSPESYPNQDYSVYVDDIFVVRHIIGFNGTGNMMPLYNASNPLSLSQGDHNYSIIHHSGDLDRIKFSYANLYLLRRGNANISNYTISYPSSSVYHEDFTVSLVGDTSSTMEISSTTISIDGQYIQTMIQSGSGNFNTTIAFDMMNGISGVVNLTINQTDSYGYENVSNYTITILDAPDVGLGVTSCPSSVSLDEEFICTVPIYNNGTANATDFNHTLSFNTGGSLNRGTILLGSQLVSLSVGEEKTLIYMISDWSTAMKKELGWHATNSSVVNTTAERIDNNIYVSSLNGFSIKLSVYSTASLRDYVPTTKLYDESGLIWTNSTSEQDYVDVMCPDGSSWCEFRLYYNITALTLDGKDPSMVTFLKYNSTSGEYYNISESMSWVNSIGVNISSEYVYLNASSFSPITVVFGDVYVPPPSTPTPSSSSNSDGYIASLSKWWKMLNQYVIVVYDSEIDKPFAEKILEKNPQAILKSYDELTDTDKKQYLICVGGSQANRCTWDVNLKLDYPFRYLGNMMYDFEGDDSNSMAILAFAKNPYAGKYTRKTVLVLAGETRVGSDMAVDYYLKNYLTLRESQNSVLI